MRLQHWTAVVATTVIMAACGASSSDDQAPPRPADSDAGDAGTTTVDTGAPIDAAPDAGPPLDYACSDFTKGAEGWDSVGDAVASSPDGFVFQLGAMKRGITKTLKSDADIRATHVRLDWTFTGDATASTEVQLLTQTYGKASLALKRDGSLIVAGNNGTSDVKATLKEGATVAQALALVQGKSFELATVWAPSGRATAENEGAVLSAEVATLSPETRGHDFTLEIGGTISGALGITVTIRQACVAFE